MIGLNYDQILNKIQEEKGTTREELDAKVNAKLDALSNLISKEGAAHIVANELGVKLFVAQTAKRFQVKDLSPALKNVEFLGKVIQVYETRSFQRGEKTSRVASIFVADETGRCRITIWDEKIIDQVPTIKEGDLLKLSGAYVKENNGYKELHLGNYSSLTVNPEGETMGEVAAKTESVNKQISDLGENEFATISGVVVQAFDPRFYDGCPDCGKKLLEIEGKQMCSQHGAREANAMPVFNFVLDDSTDTIRVVCFRQQAEKILKADQAKLKELRNNQEMAATVASGIVGSQFKVTGKTNKNIMFDRLEFSANSIEDLDPADMA